MSPRPLAVLVCVCAIGSADAGCAKKRVAVTPLPPVTIAKSYPGKGAMDAMREAIRKLRRRPQQRTGAKTKPEAVPRSADEQPVGTTGADAAQTTPRAAPNIGRDIPAPAPDAPATRAAAARTQRASGRIDPLVALIVGGWIAVLVLLPLAIRYGWRG